MVVYNGTTHRLVYTYTVYTHIYWIHLYWYYNGTFLAFVEAKASITSSKLTCRDKSCSMLSVLRETSLSWPVLLRIWFFMSLSLLNDRSPLATVTGKVRNILRAMHTLGNSEANFRLVISFSKASIGGYHTYHYQLSYWHNLFKVIHFRTYSSSFATSTWYVLTNSLHTTSRF